MLDSLLHLPYVHYWLPALTALGLGLPVYWFAQRSSRRPAEPPKEPELTVKVEAAPDKDPFATGGASEQRKACRRKGNPIEILIAPEQGPARPERGYVLDRSVSGLRLMMARDVPPGTVLTVRPASASPMIPWVQVEVRNCTPSHTQPGEFDLGVQFVKSPPYPVLLLFG
jgi:hypothetical protein